MRSYRLTVAARSDIEAIAEHTVRQFGVAQAIEYRDGLIRAFELLSAYPFLARERTEINPPVRAHPHQSHIILYIVQDDDVLILGVRHTSEDWINDSFDQNA